MDSGGSNMHDTPSPPLPNTSKHSEEAVEIRRTALENHLVKILRNFTKSVGKIERYSFRYMEIFKDINSVSFVTMRNNQCLF